MTQEASQKCPVVGETCQILKVIKGDSQRDVPLSRKEIKLFCALFSVTSSTKYQNWDMLSNTLLNGLNIKIQLQRRTSFATSKVTWILCSWVPKCQNASSEWLSKLSLCIKHARVDFNGSGRKSLLYTSATRDRQNAKGAPNRPYDEKIMSKNRQNCWISPIISLQEGFSSKKPSCKISRRAQGRELLPEFRKNPPV